MLGIGPHSSIKLNEMFASSVVSIHWLARGLCRCKPCVQVPCIARWFPATARTSC